MDWLVDLMINVDLAIVQPYLDLEAGDNQSLQIQVARPGIEPNPEIHVRYLLRNGVSHISGENAYIDGVFSTRTLKV